VLVSAAVTPGTGWPADVPDLAARVMHWRDQAVAKDPPNLVVAVSNSYGAGGGVIGPAVARRLGLPFLDRAIPAEVAEALGAPLTDVACHDDRTEGGVKRLVAAMARSAALFGPGVLQRDDVLGDEPTYRLATELVLWQMAAQTGGVVLGRAATVALASHPGVLRVRLDAPLARRIRQAVAADGMDEPEARRMQEQTDRARDAYTHHFYGVHPGDPNLYDLTIDVSRFGYQVAEEMIVLAARTRLPPAGPAPAAASERSRSHRGI
jgi:cytidylate kinase